jgi:hypothetical protein
MEGVRFCRRQRSAPGMPSRVQPPSAPQGAGAGKRDSLNAS